MESVLNYLLKLYKENRQISLLSWFYGFVAVLFIFIAGLCALVNQPFGVGLLIVPLVAMIALCANVTVWALVKLFIQHIEEYQNTKHAEEKTAPKIIASEAKKDSSAKSKKSEK